MKLKELLKLIPALPWHLAVEEDSNSDGITENVAVIYDHENLGEEIVRTVTHSDAPDEGTVHEGAMLNAKYLHHAANVLPGLVNAVREYTKERDYQNVAACKKDQDCLEKLLLAELARAEEVEMENDELKNAGH